MPLCIPIQYCQSTAEFIIEDGMVRTNIPSKQCSDGHHTFEELYEHRYILWITLCRFIAERRYLVVWRSKLHADGTMFDNSFILGVGQEPGEQITYHLHLDKWDMCNFAQILDHAPVYDGHKPEDVLNRIKELIA